MEPSSVPRGAYHLTGNQRVAWGNFLCAAITMLKESRVEYKNHVEKHASASAVLTSMGSRAKLPGFESNYISSSSLTLDQLIVFSAYVF